MDKDLIREFLLSCQEAKKICELLPPLPKKMKPRHVRVLDAVHTLQEKNGIVRVSDVASEMGGTLPSITKLVNELCAMKILTKTRSAEDKRVYHLELTKLGDTYYDKYVTRFRDWLSDELDEISEDDLVAAIRTIMEVKRILVSNRHPI